jgi:anti-anti-sigma factor
MATREAAASVHERDGTAVIELSGEIDRSAEAAVETAYGQASGIGTGPMLLDFTATDYINSTGIALIVGVLARARADGREVRACGLSDHYREIFEITRLADFMSIFPDEASALAANANDSQQGGTNG